MVILLVCAILLALIAAAWMIAACPLARTLLLAMDSWTDRRLP